ncbi:MAG: ABC transporter ATP-binding protein [Limnochordaceae bacterium]|nr:ABC transporter ATP-binding protein [Limnochordaceae bacterium]
MSPLLFKTALDVAIPSGNTAMLVWLLVGMVVTPVVQAGLNSLQEYGRASIGEAVANELRRKLFIRVIQAPLPDLERVTSGQIIHRITRECGRVGEVFVGQEVVPLFSNMALVLGTFVVMVLLNWQLGFIAMVVFPPSFLLSGYVGRIARDLDSSLIAHLEKGQEYLQELFANIKTVRAFNAVEVELSRWDDWLEKHRRHKAHDIVYHNLSRVLFSDVINNLVLGMVFGYGALQVMNGDMTTGDLIAFISYLPRAYAALRLVLNTHVESEKIKAAVQAIDQLISLPQETQWFGALPARSDKSPAIEFRNVSFRYRKDGFHIDGVSFTVEWGEFLGIVGPSGAGKSTIFDLLLGFYVPASGSIMVGGVDIRLLSLVELRKQFAFIPQDHHIWRNSLAFNLAYPHGDVDPQLLRRAVRDAQLEDLVAALPHDLATELGERGANLSGGECQRIAIARALVRQAPILLMDEATASLDALTELRLRKALQAAAEGRTLLVIAHRLATVMDADKILVLQAGRVVEYGSPAELLRRQGLFYEMYQAQKLKEAKA